jgi:hypothetical protein
MSRIGGCYDNAPMQSFFHSLEVELVHQRRWATRGEARRDLFGYRRLSQSAAHSLGPRVSHARLGRAESKLTWCPRIRGKIAGHVRREPGHKVQN